MGKQKTTLAERQRKATRAELERDLKRKDREKLRALREQIKAAKQTKKEKLRAVTVRCREGRTRARERAKRARERLRQSIQRAYEHARTTCGALRGAAHDEAMQAVANAARLLEEERTLQAQLRVWTRPKVCAVKPGQRRARSREEVAESDCQVAQNIDDAALLPVWEKVKHRIRATDRKTRTEAFFEWAAENPAEVYEIQERATEEAIAALIREEERLARAVQEPKRYARVSVAKLEEKARESVRPIVSIRPPAPELAALPSDRPATEGEFERLVRAALELEPNGGGLTVSVTDAGKQSSNGSPIYWAKLWSDRTGAVEKRRLLALHKALRKTLADAGIASGKKPEIWLTHSQWSNIPTGQRIEWTIAQRERAPESQAAVPF